MTSRAVQYARYGGPEVLELVERETPVPGPGQVRLAVRAAAVNPIDWKLRGGAFASTDAPATPVVDGQDVAGVVEALGDGVDGIAVGDEVLGQATGGAYAEQVLAETSALAPRPPGVSWEVAASLGVVASTAYRVLDQLGLGAGDDARGRTLLVTGASGGVGVFAVQAAVARGVSVVGVAGPTHQDLVAALGATPVPYGDGLADRVRRAAPGGVDAVFDTAGQDDLGDLVALAGAADRVITIAHSDAGEYGVTFSGGGGDEVGGVLAEVAAALADGSMRAPVVVVYPLADAARAQEDNRLGRVHGKLVLVP